MVDVRNFDFAAPVGRKARSKRDKIASYETTTGVAVPFIRAKKLNPEKGQCCLKISGSNDNLLIRSKKKSKVRLFSRSIRNNRLEIKEIKKSIDSLTIKNNWLNSNPVSCVFCCLPGDESLSRWLRGRSFPQVVGFESKFPTKSTRRLLGSKDNHSPVTIKTCGNVLI